MNSNDIAAFYDARTNVKTQTITEFEIPMIYMAPYQYVRAQLIELPKSSFLDIGCGPGNHTIFAAKNQFKAVGIDISKESLAIAKHSAKTLNICENVSFFEMPAENARSLGQFEVVFENAVFYYLDFSAIESILNLNLSEGGYFFAIETYGANPLFALWRWLRHLRGQRDRASVFKLWGKREVARMLTMLKDGKARYFDFLTVILTVLRPMPKLQARFYPLAAWLDNIILNHWGFDFLAFKVVISGRKK